LTHMPCWQLAMLKCIGPLKHTPKHMMDRLCTQAPPCLLFSSHLQVVPWGPAACSMLPASYTPSVA
jgi:hypothetical protein